jgi:NAD(P)-dependent dehydrogenase (short-subunit alcohol dehydrogenase family)
VSSESSVESAVGDVLAKLGGCDALVNVAGVTSPTTVVDMSLAEWERIFAVNSTGTFLVTRAVLPTMVASRYGRIVNMSSVSAIRGGGVFGGAHYSAAKAAVLGFTRALAREVAALGITCNAVAPGLVDTDLAAPHLSAEQRRAVLAGIPVGRLGTPADVAAVIGFLCSEESGYVTGEVVDINGGSHID